MYSVVSALVLLAYACAPNTLASRGKLAQCNAPRTTHVKASPSPTNLSWHKSILTYVIVEDATHITFRVYFRLHIPFFLS